MKVANAEAAAFDEPQKIPILYRPPVDGKPLVSPRSPYIC